MAPQSSPPNPTIDSNSPTSESIQASLNEGQETPEPPLKNSQTSFLENSQPLREEQVENAVKFLSHPRVRGSPVIHRRNFLEKKGLTKEEIDEAFQRVPDPSPTSASDQTSAHQDAQVATNTSAQASVQAIQTVTSVPSGVMSTSRRRCHWSHALLAVGLLAFSGAWSAIIIKNSVIPRLKSWIRKVVMDEEELSERKSDKKPSLAEEFAVAAKSAAAAAVDVARVSQEMLITKSEDKKCFAEFLSLLDVQVHEMRTMKSAISKFEGQLNSAGTIYSREEYLNGSLVRSTQPSNGKYEFDTRAVRSVSPPASTELPHPKSYSEIMDTVLRGERPPNVRDIDDRPPNPNQPISTPNLAPRLKPWEVSQPVGNSTFAPQPQVINQGPNKTARYNGGTHQFNNDIPTPWWQQNNARIAEIENDNVVVVDRPPVRRWVPPQPPPVLMPEAARAIRQPKSIPRNRTLTADEVAQHVSWLEELQRVTKISEFGCQIKMNEGQDQIIEV